MSNFFGFLATSKARLPSQAVYVLSLILSIFIIAKCHASDQSPKAKWYRYYDQNGVANLSSTVTPAHIRYGYEALDSNMQVIKKNQAYNSDQDLKLAHVRAQKSRQQEQDLKLKKAYGSSKVAILKRDELLKNYNKQIALQQQQLKQIQKDRILFKRQEMEYFRKGKSVPNDLKDRLDYNMQNLSNTKKNIDALQTDYRNTQVQYETIINRLKAFE